MENAHIVKSFDVELDRLSSVIAEMGGLAESQLADAVLALTRRDEALASSVILQDRQMDTLEASVDTHALRMLALRQPQAVDLRAIVAALRISAELERIGDYAKNLAKRSLTLLETAPIGSAAMTIERMSKIVGSMISNVIDAYVTRDMAKADDVRVRDAEVDAIHTSLFRELLTYMMEDPRNITSCTHLLFIAKNIERMGDHTTNIAEQVHFMVAGEVLGHDRPKEDLSSSTIFKPEDKSQ